MTQITTQIFKERAIKMHGERYDYSLVVYTHMKTKVRVICPQHGEFLQKAESHLNGHGCKKCNPNLLTLARFVSQARRVHGTNYDYSLTLLQEDGTVWIRCLIHGEFSQYYASHLNGHGCSLCAKEKTYFQKQTLEEFVAKANKLYNSFFDYSRSNYIDSTTALEIRCPQHGSFFHAPGDHLKGSGCPYCNGGLRKRLTTQDFITRSKLVHGELYFYRLTSYQGIHKTLLVECRKHGVFSTVADDHLKGSGCPRCSWSKGELQVARVLEQLGLGFETQKSFRDCINPKTGYKLKFDFWIPELKVLIEYDGFQHFEIAPHFAKDLSSAKVNLAEQKLKDACKTSFCNKNSLALIRISYLEDVKESLLSQLEPLLVVGSTDEPLHNIT